MTSSRRPRALRRRYAHGVRIVHTIREGRSPEPVVTHVFYGRTQKDAEAIYAAHRESDKFLRECDDKGCFGGSIRCNSQIHEVRE